MLTQRKLKTIVTYFPDTGVFIRNLTGLDESTISTHGYKRMWVGGRRIEIHRLACLYMTGKFPAKGLEVDHINRDKLDNRWSNLRVVTKLQNNLNKGIQKNNKSGAVGVVKTKNNTYIAQIGTNGNKIYLGTFDTMEAAVTARAIAEIKYFKEFRKN